jgi:hypothetical protein
MRMVDHIVDHFAVDHACSTNQQVNYSIVRLTNAYRRLVLIANNEKEEEDIYQLRIELTQI